MKKIFIIGSFLALFLLGCQSESTVAPVQTNDNTGGISTLQKPSPAFYVEFYNNPSDPQFICTWGSYGGAKSFDLFYKKPGETNYTLYGNYPAPRHGYATIVKIHIFGWESGTYSFELQALNNKGESIGLWSMERDATLP